MSIKQRGNVWWMYFTTPGGKRIRRSAGTTNRKEAQERHDALRSECWRVDVLGEMPRRTWDEVALLYLKSFESKDKARHVKHFTKHFRGVALQDISQHAVDQSLNDLPKPFTYNRHLSTLRHLFNWAADKKYGKKQWFVKGLREPKKRVEWLTREEAGALIQSLPEQHRSLVRFALCTGLRLNNILFLEWRQVDLQRGCAWIHADQAKGDEPIAVPLNSDAKEVIRGQIGKDLTRVFPRNRIDMRIWKKALLQAGITRRFRFHDLRHTWASWHVQAGTPLQVLQELGAWKDMTMVLRYAHLNPAHLTTWSENVSKKYGQV